MGQALSLLKEVITLFRNLGATELIIIALILILLFGGKKIPEFVRAIGDAIKEFRQASKDKNK